MPDPERPPTPPRPADPPPDWTSPAGRAQAQPALRRLLSDLGLERAPPPEVARTATREVFTRRGLGRLLRTLYQDDPYRALTDVRPALRTWRHEPVPDAYWHGVDGIARAVDATRRLLAELGAPAADPRQLVAEVSLPVFEWYGLGPMLRIVYAGVPAAALRPLVPAIPPWRPDPAPRGYWQGLPGVERAQAATRRLIGEHGWGGLSAAEIGGRVSRQLFLAQGLGGMLDAVYDRQGYAALHDLYPDLRPWQMAMCPSGYWQAAAGRQHARAATHWLITRLGLSSAPLRDIAQRVDQRAFAAHGLGGMLGEVYGQSAFAALQDVFPALRPWLVGRVAPHDYWHGAPGREHAREALRWMLGHLGLEGGAPATVAQAIDHGTFRRLHLSGMLSSAYANSPYAALVDLYPDLQPWQMRAGVPNGYWVGEAGRARARTATRWLLARYQLEAADPALLAAVLDTDIFAEHGLYGMLSAVYHQSSYAALADLFPQLPRYTPRAHRPAGYWQGEEGRARARAAVGHMLARLGLGDAAAATVAAQVDKSVFAAHGLGSLLRTMYGGSAYAALHDLYPDLRPWQMGAKVPQDCWTGAAGRENARAATRDLLVRLGLGGAAPADVAQTVDADTFAEAGLGTMLARVYAGSPYQALRDQYPDLQPWQMAKTPREYWQGPDARAHGRAATQWLLARLGLAPEPGQRRLAAITKATFAAHGLAGMLGIVYGNSPGAALADAIPGLAPWERHTVPRGYWQGEGARERARAATRRLLAERGLSGAEPGAIAAAIGRTEFVAAGLGGMVAGVYRGSVYGALVDVLPELRPWQMGSPVPLHYWQEETGREHAREAVRWLLDELGLQGAAPAQIGAAATQAAFRRYGLDGLLTTVYGSSRYAALADVVAEVRPWHMGRAPQGYWQGADAGSRATEALHWLLGELGLAAADPVAVARTLDATVLRRYGLAGMLQEVYGGSLFWALAALFPAIRAWEVPLPTPQGYWQGAVGRERAREALRWAVARMGRDPDDPGRLAGQVSGADLGRLGLRGMLTCVYGDSVRRALEDAFGGAPGARGGGGAERAP